MKLFARHCNCKEPWVKKRSEQRRDSIYDVCLLIYSGSSYLQRGFIGLRLFDFNAAVNAAMCFISVFYKHYENNITKRPHWWSSLNKMLNTESFICTAIFKYKPQLPHAWMIEL